MRHQVFEQHLAREPELSQQQRQFVRSLVERYELLAQTAQEDTEGRLFVLRAILKRADSLTFWVIYRPPSRTAATLLNLPSVPAA